MWQNMNNKSTEIYEQEYLGESHENPIRQRSNGVFLVNCTTFAQRTVQSFSSN